MKKYKFDAQMAADSMVLWLKQYFDNGGKPLNAVVGCSGGKDSSVVLAALLTYSHSSRSGILPAAL